MGVFCEYCKKEFSSNSSLNYHKKTAKFCAKLQESFTDNTITHDKFTCEFCKKEFVLKLSWTKHITTCKTKEQTQTKDCISENELLKNQIEQLKKEYDIKVFEIQSSHHKEINQQKKYFENKLIEIEKENISLKTELKVRNDQIKEIHEKHEQHTSQLRHEIQSLTEKLTARSITNNTNNTYIFNGIDFSQQRFDNHVRDKYTFNMYLQGYSGAKTLLVDFIYFDQTIIAEISDDSRDKIKVMDTYGNKKYISFNDLLNLCKNSNTLVQQLQNYSNRMFENRSYTLEICQDVSKKNTMFKRKALKIIFGDVKAFVNLKNENRIEHRIENEEKLLITA